MNYEKLTKTDGKEYYLVPVEEKDYSITNKCIDIVKSHIHPRCDNHTAYRGECSECGYKCNPDELSDPNSLISDLENLKIKAEEKQYDFVCEYSGEKFMVGDKCFYLNAPTIGCLPIEDEIKECYKKYNYIAFFHKKESAIEWQKHRFNNKEVQLNYVFDKNYYVISGFGEEEKTLPYFNSEFISDRYKSVEECNKALYAYIWNTHKITAVEYLLVYGLFINRGFKTLKNKIWKKFYCNYIINQVGVYRDWGNDNNGLPSNVYS